VRDKTKFVPMNLYTHGAMMDDYVFLEDVGRRVSEWGRDIVRGGYDAGALPLQHVGGGGYRRQQRRGGGETRWGRRKTDWKKRDVLRSQLELRDIEVDLLSTGMARRTLNQSTWDPKCVGLDDADSVQYNDLFFYYRRKRTAFLTVEYRIHPPVTLDARPDEAQEPYTLLTHRNNFDLPLRDLFQSHISQRTKGKTRADLPTWVKTLALPDPDIPDAFTPPQFFIRAPLDPLSGRSEKFGFIKLDSERRFSALLRNKQFVEFPTIEVWEEGAFRGVLLDGTGALEPRGSQRPAKRRRLDVTKGRAAIAGLLGGYGSDGGDEADTALTRLEEYEGSDAENEQPTTSDEDDTGDLTEESNDDDDEEPNAVVDPAALLAMVQEVQRRHDEDEEYDEVDWGESDKDS
jgi:hypothetical protein